LGLSPPFFSPLPLSPFSPSAGAAFCLAFIDSRSVQTSPASVAATARAAIRPWNRNAPRSNAALVMPFARAFSASALPTTFAAATLPPCLRPEF
jgi:hypothetical protein